MPTATSPQTTNSSLQRDARALEAALSELMQVYQFRDRERICCHDISVTQCHALEVLVEHGPMRLGQLSARLFLDKSTTSRVVHTLIKKGYVEQRPETEDRRATALITTRRGRELSLRIKRDLLAEQQALLADLAPEIRVGAIEVLRRLAKAADARFRTGNAGQNCSTAGCGPAGRG
jgi:MarR family 2-MHQ and catechol resistance regulon transcriptional repressor